MNYAQRSWLGARSSIAAGPASLAATALLVAVGLLAVLAPAAHADGCSNESTRVEQGAMALGDCRAYEMLTPVEKGSGGPEPVEQTEFFEGRELQPLVAARLFGAAGAQAAVDGERMAWLSEPIPGSVGSGLNQVSVRGPGGWISHDLVPPLSVSNDVTCPFSLGVSGWSPNLTKAILDLPAGPPATNAAAPHGFFEEHECGHDEPRLAFGEPRHFRNLFSTTTATAATAWSTSRRQVCCGQNPKKKTSTTGRHRWWLHPRTSATSSSKRNCRSSGRLKNCPPKSKKRANRPNAPAGRVKTTSTNGPTVKCGWSRCSKEPEGKRPRSMALWPAPRATTLWHRKACLRTRSTSRSTARDLDRGISGLLRSTRGRRRREPLPA